MAEEKKTSTSEMIKETEASIENIVVRFKHTSLGRKMPLELNNVEVDDLYSVSFYMKLALTIFLLVMSFDSITHQRRLLLGTISWIFYIIVCADMFLSAMMFFAFEDIIMATCIISAGLKLISMCVFIVYLMLLHWSFLFLVHAVLLLTLSFFIEFIYIFYAKINEERKKGILAQELIAQV
ncbi:hypothetical protein GINT2_002040 [Glugoides intestinalis]